MGSGFKSGSACTKVKAMFGMRITGSEYENLITRNSIPLVVSFLEAHPLYKDVMKGTDENSIRRSDLENLIRKGLSTDYKKLEYFMSDRDKEMLRTYTLRSEIEFILRLIIQLRNKAGVNKEEIMLIVPQSYYVKYSDNMMSLLTADTLKGLIDLMKNTKYVDVLDEYDLESVDTAVIETALFNHLYRMVFKLIDANYQREEADGLKRQLGMRIDIENIRRVIRLKKYFSNLDYNKYILKFGYRLSPAVLCEIISSSDMAEELAAFIPIYGIYYNEASLTNSDESKHRIQLSLDRNILRMSKSASESAIAYLSIKAIEIKNLFHIIESIRYGVSPDVTRSSIINMESNDDQ